MSKRIELLGRIFVCFEIQAVTGLHIGGSDTGIEIGGVDKIVIRDRLTNRPYIPGSSLRGKMRSLLEKYGGLEQNQRIGQGYIHSCTDKNIYATCRVCRTFGVPGERGSGENGFGTPARLVVRDVLLTDESAEELTKSRRTDLPFTEVKTEVSIDRVTSAANPRQLERVPAGARFGQAELVYSVYDGDECDPEQDVDFLRVVVEGLQLLEDDYLGGQGARGSGKVSLHDIAVTARSKGDYLGTPTTLGGPYATLGDLVAGLGTVQAGARTAFGLSA
jgi:CRISPR-associated protein Csm3